MVWTIAAINGGRGCTSGPEQMGRHVHTDRFPRDCSDQGADVRNTPASLCVSHEPQ